MSYTVSVKESRLLLAVRHLEGIADIPGHCLGYVRQALEIVPLSLPPAAQIQAGNGGHSTALGAYHLLTAAPARFGWQRVGYPDVHPVTLVFMGNCGVEISSNGEEIICGHVALWEKKTGILRSSKDYSWSHYWANRLLGEFVPIG